MDFIDIACLREHHTVSCRKPPRVDKACPAGQNKFASQCWLARVGPAQHTAQVPEWRNWQTSPIQVLVLASEWRLESSLGHQFFHPFTADRTFSACNAPSGV